MRISLPRLLKSAAKIEGEIFRLTDLVLKLIISDYGSKVIQNSGLLIHTNSKNNSEN